MAWQILGFVSARLYDAHWGEGVLGAFCLVPKKEKDAAP